MRQAHQNFTRLAIETRLIAILRGIKTAESVDIVEALFESGVRIVEVPLNSPRAIKTIARLVAAFDGRMIIGAGTVLEPSQVTDVVDAGGELIISPNYHAPVLKEAIRLGVPGVPGVATPTEAFAAIRAGARSIKVFPAENITPYVIRSWRAVLPPEICVIPVGGIGIGNISSFLEAGADAFGIGGSLYRPGKTAGEIRVSALEILAQMSGA